MNEMIIPRGDLKGYDAEQVQTWLIQEKKSWLALACAYAAVENQVSILMHDYDKEDDFFLEQFDKWVCLDKVIYIEIKEVLIELNKEEGTACELTGGTIEVTLPFMEANGYHNISGWWTWESDKERRKVYRCTYCGKYTGTIITVGKGRTKKMQPQPSKTDCLKSKNGKHRWRME